jgi:hypothetical protein
MPLNSVWRIKGKHSPAHLSLSLSLSLLIFKAYRTCKLLQIIFLRVWTFLQLEEKRLHLEVMHYLRTLDVVLTVNCLETHHQTCKSIKVILILNHWLFIKKSISLSKRGSIVCFGAHND